MVQEIVVNLDLTSAEAYNIQSPLERKFNLTIAHSSRRKHDDCQRSRRRRRGTKASNFETQVVGGTLRCLL